MRCARTFGVFLLITLPVAEAAAEPPSVADLLGSAFWSQSAKAATTPKKIAKPAAAAKSVAPPTVEKPVATPAKPAAGTTVTQAPAAPAPAPVKPAAAVPAPKPATAPAAVAAPSAAKVAPVVAAGAGAAPAATDDPDGDVAANPAIKPGSKEDTRPAKKLFGAAKAPAALAARAIGGYAKGCLAGGRALAIDGPAWQAMRLSRNRNWGHPKLIALLERFAKEMQDKEKWPGLLIGDLAQPRGGPMLTGHKSHQVGLDADIWFRPLPEKRMTVAERETTEPLLLAKDNGSEVIAENYNEGFMRLVKRAASYPEVERVFVHPAIKKAFCNGAGEDRAWLRKVRPIWLHNYHFHVRIGCPEGSTTCVPQKAVEAEGDGCGKDVDDWIKLVSTPPKAMPKPVEPAAPVKPEKPKPPLMLKDLPPECTAVIAAADPKPQPAKAPAVAGTPVTPNAKAAQKQ